MPRIDYESEGFPAGGPVANGIGTLDFSWGYLLWSALTVGRPNLYYVFQHGQASMYEALFRLSLVRMALEQFGPHAHRLRRTAVARGLDPSEKGAVNYFLGMTICKLFADSLLNAPWLLHLDVFRPALNLVLTGRSRPDLVGQTNLGQWLALESKGRISPPNADAKQKAKQQAQRCVSVAGNPVAYPIGGIAYFRGDVLRFYWRDPTSEREPPNTFRIDFDDRLWEFYYRPVLSLIESDSDLFAQMRRQPVLMRVRQADIQVGVHPQVLELLTENNWVGAKQWCIDSRSTLADLEYENDGIRVIAGPTWVERFGERS